MNHWFAIVVADSFIGNIVGESIVENRVRLLYNTTCVTIVKGSVRSIYLHRAASVWKVRIFGVLYPSHNTFLTLNPFLAFST